MNRRIKHVWTISIVAMAAIFAMEAYWLYNQYEYSSMVKAEEMKEACAKAFETEKNIRIDKYGDIIDKYDDMIDKYDDMIDKYDDIKYNNSNVKMLIVLQIGQSVKKRKEKNKPVKSTIRYTLPDTKKKLSVKNIDMSEGVEMASRYMVSQNRRFDRSTFDSLLYAAEGIKTDIFKFVKTNRCMMKPVFSVSGGLSKTLHVKYSTNPFNMEAVEMTIPIPLSQTLKLMIWKFAASVVLLVILGFCMMYQIKTIMIQRRINAIRHEFMKNMIYEMKQPPETSDDDTTAIKIGSTLFFYELNELRHGNEKVIITSRQAELLRILAENLNKVVGREMLLKEVWGDDSYSNSMALNVQITYLRRALKSDSSLSIEAIIRKGYVLKDK
ncbi:winged helix-turn-helix domain-containing protein [uncultured Prevotella sp.]|uniref:winged helix-turn-helix domain-containing protein n=1 Tax=uncultured Prevotella sp. TaxID=159272 RepID=UPI0025F432CB|nr:winged helix-turn-helix domain-containing protein [uncultured Prevotella sp.]